MAEELDIETIFKLKVDGLKEELEKRKLLKSGTKAQLQERLLNHLTLNDIAAITSKDDPLDDTTEDEELNKEIEDSLDKIDTPTVLNDGTQKFLGDEAVDTPPAVEEDKKEEEEEKEEVKKTETEKVETKSNENENVVTPTDEKEKEPELKKDSASKIKKISLSESEKIEQRSKRFGATVSVVEKKKSRMERFGDSKTSDAKAPATGGSDKIADRAARFGTNKTTNNNTTTTTTTVASADSTVPAPTGGTNKLKERQGRFLDDKIKKRQERFGVVQATTTPTNDIEARKRQRALKFGGK